MGELLRRRSVPSPRGVRNTFGRIVHGSGWLVGAGLLVLLISTNCTVVSTPLCSSDFECGAPDQVCDQNKCIVGCRGPEQCAVGETCEPHPGIPLGSAAGQCIANVCNDSESSSACPTDTTCWPPGGSGVCTPRAQVGCDGGLLSDVPACTAGICQNPDEVCGAIVVHVAGGTEQACGCIPAASSGTGGE